MGRFAPPELVAAVLDDAGAVEPLIAAIWPHCYRLAAAVIGERGLAQDAAQEACVVVHRSLRRLRSPDAFDGWIYRIVVREATRIARRRRPIEPDAAVTLAPDDPTSLDVWRALAALPPELRAVVILFYFDDLPGDAIARVLGVAPVTVRTRLARARERLRGLLDDEIRSAANSWEAASHAV